MDTKILMVTLILAKSLKYLSTKYIISRVWDAAVSQAQDSRFQVLLPAQSGWGGGEGEGKEEKGE